MFVFITTDVTFSIILSHSTLFWFEPAPEPHQQLLKVENYVVELL